MREEMKDTVDVLLKLDIDADDFYNITIWRNNIWFQGKQTKENLERYPDAVPDNGRIKGSLYKVWRYGNVLVEIILDEIN